MNNIGTRRFETERLILRRFKLSDVDAVFDNWASDEEVSRYVGWNAHKDKIETLKLVSGWIEDYKNKSYNWAVELKDTHELIGNISAFNVSKKNRMYKVIGLIFKFLFREKLFVYQKEGQVSKVEETTS